MNILSLTRPWMIQLVHLSASFCVPGSTCCTPQCKTMQGRQTVKTQFPQGLSKMYGLCGNWVSLMWNGAIVAETHYVDIPPYSSVFHTPIVLSFTCMSSSCRMHNAVHAVTNCLCAQTTNHFSPHHAYLLSSVEWTVQSYLAFLLHPTIHYWCNGALYLNAAMPVTSTSAWRQAAKQAIGSERLFYCLKGLVRWLTWAWTLPCRYVSQILFFISVIQWQL